MSGRNSVLRCETCRIVLKGGSCPRCGKGAGGMQRSGSVGAASKKWENKASNQSGVSRSNSFGRGRSSARGGRARGRASPKASPASPKASWVRDDPDDSGSPFGQRRGSGRGRGGQGSAPNSPSSKPSWTSRSPGGTTPSSPLASTGGQSSSPSPRGGGRAGPPVRGRGGGRGSGRGGGQGSGRGGPPTRGSGRGGGRGRGGPPTRGSGRGGRGSGRGTASSPSSKPSWVKDQKEEDDAPTSPSPSWMRRSQSEKDFSPPSKPLPLSPGKKAMPTPDKTPVKSSRFSRARPASGSQVDFVKSNEETSSLAKSDPGSGKGPVGRFRSKTMKPKKPPPPEETDGEPVWAKRDNVLGGPKRVISVSKVRCLKCKNDAEPGIDLCTEHSGRTAAGADVKEGSQMKAIRNKQFTLDDSSWIRNGDVELDPTDFQLGALTFLKLRDRKMKGELQREAKDVLKAMKVEEKNVCFVCKQALGEESVCLPEGLLHPECFQCCKCSRSISVAYAKISTGGASGFVCEKCHASMAQKPKLSEGSHRMNEHADKVQGRLQQLLAKGPPRKAPPATPGRPAGRPKTMASIDGTSARSPGRGGQRPGSVGGAAPSSDERSDQSATTTIMKEFGYDPRKNTHACGLHNVATVLAAARKPPKRGWLEKAGKKMGWKRRWMVLLGGKISYFATDKFLLSKKDDMKTIPLRVGSDYVVDGKNLDFSLRSDGRSIANFRAASQPEKQAWMNAIMDHLAPLIPAPAPPNRSQPEWIYEGESVRVVLDGRPVVCVAEDGEITSFDPGNMGMLLANETEFDDVFVDRVILTRRHAVTAQEQLDQLAAQFFRALPRNADALDREHHRAVLAGIQQRVLVVLRRWCESHWEVDFRDEEQLVNNVITFLAAAEHEGSSPEVRALAQWTFERFQSAVNVVQDTIPVLRAVPVASGLTSASSGGVLDFDANVLAQQLCIADSDFFNKIQPCHFAAFLWEKNTAKRDQIAKPIEQFIERFNEVSYWVATEICLAFNLKKRTIVMERLIAVAAKCFQHNNFNSMMAIVSGLNTSPVSRLKKTFAGLSKKSTAMLCKLEALMDPQNNYSTYRSELRKLQGNVALVPFFGLFIQDFTFMNDGNPKMVGGLLNTEKLWMIAELCEYWVELQELKYSFKPNDGVLLYLSSLATLDEWILYANSLMNEPRKQTEKVRLIDKWISEG